MNAFVSASACTATIRSSVGGGGGGGDGLEAAGRGGGIGFGSEEAMVVCSTVNDMSNFCEIELIGGPADLDTYRWTFPWMERTFPQDSDDDDDGDDDDESCRVIRLAISFEGAAARR